MYVVMYVAVPSNFDESGFNVAYLYLEMGYNSFQGFILALLFCFLNEEVRFVICSLIIDATALGTSPQMHSLSHPKSKIPNAVLILLWTDKLQTSPAQVRDHCSQFHNLMDTPSVFV